MKEGARGWTRRTGRRVDPVSTHRGADGLRRLPEPQPRVRNLRPGAVDEQ